MSRARFRSARSSTGQRRFGRWLDYLLAAAILGLALLLAARVDQVAERSRAGIATIHDGDTLTVDGQRVRLRGIDAPEYGQSCEAAGSAYPCGRQARTFLAGLTKGKSVACRGWERDIYDRLLGVCTVGAPPLDINREMVRRGWAVAYGDYRADEELARNARLGLWQGDFERPRDWRRDHEADRAGEAEHNSMSSLWNWLRQMVWP